jgi:hypothetical protein
MDIEDVFAKVLDDLAKMEGSNDKELKRVIEISWSFLKFMRSDSRRRHK